MIRPFEDTLTSIHTKFDNLKFAFYRRRAMKTKDWEDMERVFEKVPALRDDREIWKHIFSYGETFDFNAYFMLRRFAPQHILSDRELMIRATLHHQRNSWFFHGFYRSVETTLQTDSSFLGEILEKRPWMLERLDNSIFDQFPDVVVQAFRPYAQWLHQTGESYQTHWWTLSQRPVRPDKEDILMDWLTAGLYYPYWWPRVCQGEKFVFLLVAEHCIPKYKRESFMRASPELRNNKAFMMQVLKIDLSLYACASKALQKDMDLVTMVFGSPHGSRIASGCPRGYTGDHPKFLLRIHQCLEERVVRHDVLIEIIFLSVLNQGSETNSIYFKIIAEYLGYRD